jgi:hypothetical protein
MNFKALVSRLPFLSRSVERQRQHIRRRLEAGTLPVTSGRTYISPARGRHMCACCRMPILPPGRECDVLEAVQLYAHKSCFKIWVAESRRAAAGVLHQSTRTAGNRSPSAFQRAY